MLGRILRSLRARREASIIRADRARAAHEGREGAGVARRRAVLARAAAMRAQMGLEPDHRLVPAGKMKVW